MARAPTNPAHRSRPAAWPNPASRRSTVGWPRPRVSTRPERRATRLRSATTRPPRPRHRPAAERVAMRRCWASRRCRRRRTTGPPTGGCCRSRCSSWTRARGPPLGPRACSLRRAARRESAARSPATPRCGRSPPGSTRPICSTTTRHRSSSAAPPVPPSRVTAGTVSPSWPPRRWRARRCTGGCAAAWAIGGR
jgi:hypothetical protein